VKKPTEICGTCTFSKSSTGFCADWVPPNPKIAVVLKMPGKDELITGAPMTGKGGRYWFFEFFEKVGLTRQDVLLAYVLRCFPNDSSFPIGMMRRTAMNTCKKWDSGLRAWNPNLFIVSINPTMLFKAPAQAKFLKRGVEKALHFASQGYRPVLLCGDEARDKYAPWLRGASKKWCGHYEEIKCQTT
jgi:uracil-DNA glycosylase family 4